jgi:NADH-quinone oxidoreductase subunit L
MTIPLIVLGIGAAIGGYVWIGLVHFQPWVDWLAPALGDIGTEHQGAYVALGAGFAAAIVGIGLAYLWYGRPGVETPAKLAAALPGLHRFLLDKWRVDELYDATLLRGSRLLGLASAGFDKVAVDGLLTTVSAELVRALG